MNGTSIKFVEAKDLVMGMRVWINDCKCLVGFVTTNEDGSIQFGAVNELRGRYNELTFAADQTFQVVA